LSEATWSNRSSAARLPISRVAESASVRTAHTPDIGVERTEMLLDQRFDFCPLKSADSGGEAR